MSSIASVKKYIFAKICSLSPQYFKHDLPSHNVGNTHFLKKTHKNKNETKKSQHPKKTPK